MLEDIKKDIEWSINRLYGVEAGGEALLAIGAVIRRLEDTLKMINAEIAGFDSEAEELLMEDIEEQIHKQFRGNINLT